MTDVVEHEFFPRPMDQDVAAHFELMEGMLSEELGGMPIDDDNISLILDVMTVAAESFAQTIARSRGTVDPESEELLSESICIRIAATNRGEAGIFNFNVDDEPEWAADNVDEPFIKYLSQRAFVIGNAIVGELEEGAKLMDRLIRSGAASAEETDFQALVLADEETLPPAAEEVVMVTDSTLKQASDHRFYDGSNWEPYWRRT